MTQGQKSSQVSGPNNAPKPVRSPGWRPDPSQSKGGGPHGSRRQRCGASRGGTQASETRWRQCWSPSDGQISGLGTGSPGDNVRKPRPQPIPSEKTSSCRGPAGPVLGEPTEPRSAIPQLPCGAPGRLVSSAPLSSGGPSAGGGVPQEEGPRAPGRQDAGLQVGQSKVREMGFLTQLVLLVTQAVLLTSVSPPVTWGRNGPSRWVRLPHGFLTFRER